MVCGSYFLNILPTISHENETQKVTLIAAIVTIDVNKFTKSARAGQNIYFVGTGLKPVPTDLKSACPSAFYISIRL